VRLTGGTASLITSIITIVFLTYFLASTNRLFSRKLVRLVPGHDDQKVLVNALSEVGAQTSRYLVLTSAISLGVGIATWLVLAAFGLPNALLLGAVTGVLNLVPYVGGLVSAALIAGAGFVAFEGLERTLFMLAAALAIHTLSGNLVTPAVLGRRLPLNPVALFACLIFWSWTWGIAGAIMAVPLTVMFKVFCEHVPRLRPMGVLLDS
jgi:predicted PurR-regulated permease PerM